MATIAQIVSSIRTAVFGKDVRESIAQGIEQCYSDTTSGVNKANAAATAANTAAANANTAKTAADKAASAANGAAGNIAAAYSESKTYAVGDYVSYNDKIYRCTTAITEAEAFTASHWTAVTLGNDVSDLKSALSEIAITDLLTSPNWINDQYVNITTGNIGISAGYSATVRYIPLKPNTTYSITRLENVLWAFYDPSFAFTSGEASNRSDDRTIIIKTGANDHYIRISCKTERISYLHIYEGYNTTPSLLEDVAIPLIDERLLVNPVAVNPTNYTKLLPDANLILTNSVYKMYFSMRSKDITTNLPFDSWITDQPVMLVTFGVSSGSNAGIQQLVIGRRFVFFRSYSRQWDDWNALHLEINVGTGYQVDQNFMSLTEAILFATQYRNAIVNVHNGTFDLYQEFIDHYGSDFFTKYEANTYPRGLHLKNNVFVRCSSGSKITFHYTGDNVNVLQQFSPINYLSDCYDGFTLENATVECSRCRYVVHDDPSDTSRSYHNHYINCKFSIDNSNNPSWKLESIIGGGLGRAGAVTIEGCYLSAVEFMKGDEGSSYHRLLSYHNDVSTDSAINSVEIRNCYLANHGRIVIYHGGSNPADSSLVLITGTRMGNSILEETVTSGSPKNMKIIEWLNEVRS